MSNKSKAIEVKTVMINPEYIRVLSDLWNTTTALYDYTTNQKAELYRISSVVRMFAYNKNRMDNIRDQVADCQKNGDLAGLRRLKKIVDYSQELKAWDAMWEKVVEDYDNLLDIYQQTTQITDDGYELLTATEILGEVYTSSKKSDMNKFEKEAKALALEINL